MAAAFTKRSGAEGGDAASAYPIGGFAMPSDCDNRDLSARSPDKALYAVRVASENHRFLANGYDHHDGVNDIRSFAFA